MPATAETVANDPSYVQMNGRTCSSSRRGVLVSSAEALLAKTGVAIEDVDVYVPHQANVRIIDHAVARLGIPEERVVMNVESLWQHSSASIPLALADAVGDGR